ncbi:MAG: Rpn family recombination-promoting nuclease/putative transposase [Bacteroidales bacterium]|nr:Rpn family recombination-promoting nuclease/putative transposase [Bacteroidales bacterium]
MTDTTNLTAKQMDRYMAIVNDAENLRTLTDMEKEHLVRSILSSTFLDLLCDFAFHYVFQRDPDLLLMLLNDFLPEKIVSIDLDPNMLASPVPADKKPVMDVLAHTEDGRQIIIEMQQEKRKAFFPRLYYYGSKLLSSQLGSGQDYAGLLPVYVFCFTNFKSAHPGCPEEQLVYEYQHREKVGGAPFTNLHTTYICELPRLAAKAPKDMNPVESWFYILKNCSTFADKPEGLDPRYDKVFEAAKTNLVPDNERIKYLRAMLSDYDKRTIGEAYFEEGVKEGVKVGKAEIVKTMLAKGADIALISEYTGLSIEEISSLVAQ